MNASDPSNREEEIFDHALDLASAEERRAYVQQACGDDAVLLARVQALLMAHQKTEGFLPADPAAPLRIGPQAFAAPLEKPGDRIGRYKLLENIGEGGCGIVYMAEQEEPIRRRVALKVIKLGMDTKSVIARFEAERQALALMDHSNIAKVFDAGATDTGRPYFVMELVRGIKITDYCDQNRLSTRARLDLFIAVCHAVQHAHQKGIIHRDLKPSNILVGSADGVPVPKVIDFGIAKATSQQPLTDKTLFTAFAQFMGTPAYMSPEQAEMSVLDIDTRSDIYSLGVLLYELLTGQPPFDPKTLWEAGLDEMRRIIRETEPPKPSTRLTQARVAADVSRLQSKAGDAKPKTEKEMGADSRRLLQEVRGDLDWIVMKCLEKDRRRRYETANALAEDLERHLDHEPVTARPPSAAYQLQKAWRRNRAMFAAGAAVAAVLVLGALVSTWQAIRATRAEQSAKIETKRAGRERDRALTAEADADRLWQTVGLQRSEDLFQKGDGSKAIAQLCQLLRKNSSNHIAAERLVNALLESTYCLPLYPPLRLPKPARSLEVSPNGLFMAATWNGSNTVIWHIADGRLLAALPHESRNSVYAEFSADSSRLLVSRGSLTEIWNWSSGKRALELRHPKPILSAHFHPSGHWVATAGEDGMVRMWDPGTGAMVRLFENPKPGQAIRRIAFSSSGDRMVGQTESSAVSVWDTATGRLLYGPLGTHLPVSSASSPIAISPRGDCVAAGTWEWAHIWDLAGSNIPRSSMLHQSWFSGVTFSPDGASLVTTGEDYSARLWDGARAVQVGALAHRGQLTKARFSADSLRVVTASQDHTARIWDALNGHAMTEPIEHPAAVLDAHLVPGGSVLVTSCADATIRVWDARPARVRMKQLIHPAGGFGVACSVTTDPPSLVSTCAGGAQERFARLWDIRTGLATELAAHRHPVTRAVFSPNGSKIATGDNSGLVILWEAAIRSPYATNSPHETAIRTLEFSRDGSLLLAGSEAGETSILDVRSGDLLGKTGKVPSAQETCLNHDARRFMVWTARQVLLFDTATCKQRSRFDDSPKQVTAAVFSPANSLFAVGFSDGAFRIWNSDNGAPSGYATPHKQKICDLQFSPDGSRLVTGSTDGTARLWDVKENRPLGHAMSHDGIVRHVAFSPDGGRLITGSGDVTVRLWDAATGLPLGAPLSINSSSRASFSPDGRWAGVGGWDRAAVICGVYAPPLPVPGWFLDFAESLAGRAVEIVDQEKTPSLESLLVWRTSLLGQPATNFYAHLLRWFWADRLTRPISPWSSESVQEHLNRVLARRAFAPGDDSVEIFMSSVRDAMLLMPTNQLGFQRYAEAVSNQSPDRTPRQQGQVDFFLRWATELSRRQTNSLSLTPGSR